MSVNSIYSEINASLLSIAKSLKIISKPQNIIDISIGESTSYHWSYEYKCLIEIDNVSSIDFNLLKGVDNARDILLQNTIQFANGFAANNALLWGARGMGKSSLIKATHAKINAEQKNADKRLILIEIDREELGSLPILMRSIAKLDAQFLIFCDDLSFDKDETSYKSLKTILDGGLEGRPKNVLFYATSNRRHIMARDMIDNEKSTAINPSEAVEEKISLSDRFGLWLGFHSCDQATYLNMVQGYITHYKIKIGENELKARAIEWSATRGARSGRVAIQFVKQIAGEMGKNI